MIGKRRTVLGASILGLVLCAAMAAVAAGSTNGGVEGEGRVRALGE